MRALLLLTLAACTAPEPTGYEGYQVSAVDVDDLAALEQLQATYDVWTEHPQLPGPVVVAHPEGQLHGTLLQPDLAALLSDARQRQMAPPPADFTAHYHPYSELLAWAEELEQRYPERVRYRPIGQTLEGRTLFVLELGSDLPGKPAAFIGAGQHAREWIGPAATVAFIEQLLADDHTDPVATRMLDLWALHIMVVHNPDGYAYTWTHDRLWRKNRSANADGSRGVDLNRNWGMAWGNNNGSSPVPYDSNYRGTAPFSELETEAIAAYLDGIPRLRRYLDVHSIGQYVLYPWGHAEVPTDDSAAYDQLGLDLADALEAPHGTVFRPGQANTRLYPMSGGAIDWAWADQGAHAVLFELRDRGQYGFVLPEEQILPVADELRSGIEALITATELDPRPRLRLTDAQARLTHLAPGATVQLYASTTGLGLTETEHGTLELLEPQLLAEGVANAGGYLALDVDLRADLGWLQAVSDGRSSTLLSSDPL